MSVNWTSKLGFVLSAAGSAIGLGAIWKFPYTAGTNGGAVFFLIFLMFTIIVGVPVLLAEFFIGRKTNKNPIDALTQIAPNPAWAWIGRLGMASCFFLLSFYSVVGGWVFTYVWHALSGTITPTTDFAALFGDTIANPMLALGFQAAFMLVTVWVVQNGISSGIERANKYLMPVLFIMFLLLAVRSLTLPNAMEGVKFLLKPDFSAITPNTWLMALGQAFFALSLGVSTMMTYASYLDNKQDLFRSANSIMWLNMLVSLLAGLVIFPAVFAFDFKPDSGPGLIFIVLPAVFQKMPFGTLLFAIFMILVALATLTSAFSMLETAIAYFVQHRPQARRRISWLAGMAIFIVGIPSALSFGLMGDFKIIGKTVFDLWDYLITSWIMPLSSLAVCVLVAWVLQRDTVIAHMREGSNLPPIVAVVWRNMLRYAAPIAILLVFANTLGWI
ncbi:sodium-dependent transporter [Wielerella bovis]|uniref:sodium-dependent transporter n=1 Tax=Wielerella bovis TaxID=2917790 RepID=UPI002018B30D|nr:sodium-dependent transporter [Wielerella bovis]ULJ65371.1 sodium-dependent transporter [Wielerella bovis]ULJ67718.1 sodium-dependent transporter [Wielerella bovis]